MAKPRFGRGQVAHFICTVPLTVAVTVALPGSTESASSDGAVDGLRPASSASARRCGSLVETLTSRISKAP